jgi:PTH1 family peptidyl-tRNA hydrolase
MFRRRPKIELSPEWLVVGLGNPGPEYRGTRHNVGFEVVDRLAEESKVELNQRKHHAVYGVGMVAGRPVVLAKPLTFMNLSGRAVLPLLHAFGLSPEKLLVIADDLDLPVGTIRFRPDGNAGGHNGHKSLIQALGTNQYARFKIGIGKSGETVDHVLGRFDPDERPIIDRVVAAVAERVRFVLENGVVAAMAKASIRLTNHE